LEDRLADYVMVTLRGLSAAACVGLSKNRLVKVAETASRVFVDVFEHLDRFRSNTNAMANNQSLRRQRTISAIPSLLSARTEARPRIAVGQFMLCIVDRVNAQLIADPADYFIWRLPCLMAYP
jgi:hypothetical protein